MGLACGLECGPCSARTSHRDFLCPTWGRMGLELAGPCRLPLSSPWASPHAPQGFGDTSLLRSVLSGRRGFALSHRSQAGQEVSAVLGGRALTMSPRSQLLGGLCPAQRWPPALHGMPPPSPIPGRPPDQEGLRGSENPLPSIPPLPSAASSLPTRRVQENDQL